MEVIRRHIEWWTTCLLLTLFSGVGYPVLHKIEHAAAIEMLQDARSGHSHADHGEAFENPYPDLTSDTCWICVRPLTLTDDLWAYENDRLPQADADEAGSGVLAPSRLENLTSARAPPAVI